MVAGEIKGIPEQSVYLEELNINDIKVIDSGKVEDGSFELTGTAPEPGLYRLRFEQNQFILLSVDKGNLKVTGDWNSLESYNINGSAPSACRSAAAPQPPSSDPRGSSLRAIPKHT